MLTLNSLKDVLKDKDRKIEMLKAFSEVEGMNAGWILHHPLTPVHVHHGCIREKNQKNVKNLLSEFQTKLSL